MRKKGKYLGEMLVDKGLLTDDQLQAMMQEQLKNKKFLGQMLVEKGLITENELFQTIAEQFNIEFVGLADEEIDWDVALGFSSSIITEHKCLPLRFDQETVVLAITNPLDAWVLETVEKEAAPNKVKVVLVKTSEMDTAIKQYHKNSIRKMMNKWKKD
jgi:type IV pilus assembly protein PilB